MLRGPRLQTTKRADVRVCAAATVAVGAAAGGQQSLARVSQLASEQVVLLSYLDTFKFFGVAFLLLLPLLLFVRPGAASGGGGGAA